MSKVSSPQRLSGPGPEIGYLQLLRLRYAAHMLGSTLIGRLPNAMAPVALLLAAREEHGSLAFGGTLSAVYLVAFAIGQPALGRAADRLGPSVPIVFGAATAATSLFALSVLGTRSEVLAVVLAAVAGLSNPPLESGLRTLWPTILPAQPTVRSRFLSVAYALDNGSQEAVYVAGPLLAAGLAVLSPGAALAATAAIGLGGGLSLGLSRPARLLRPLAAEQRDWLGPLRSSAVLVLLGMLMCAGGVVGAVRVSAVAQGQDLGVSWFAGALPAVMSCGGLVGGLVYGARSWRGGLYSHLALLAGAHVLAWAPLLIGLGPAATLTAITVPGLCFSTLVCVACLLINAVAPAGTTTEAFGWLIAAINLGIAGGTAAAGWAGGHYGVALVAAGGAALVLLLGGSRVRAGSSPAGAGSTAVGEGADARNGAVVAPV
ncbi:transporter (plasmid) [Streptomyces sp. NBC_01527]|uniref:MFS transporter n=1 Tax=Streptomyces sp. NBC_01527 TaxID=2903894 RepID=UPI002F90D100